MQVEHEELTDEQKLEALIAGNDPSRKKYRILSKIVMGRAFGHYPQKRFLFIFWRNIIKHEDPFYLNIKYSELAIRRYDAHIKAGIKHENVYYLNEWLHESFL